MTPLQSLAGCHRRGHSPKLASVLALVLSTLTCWPGLANSATTCAFDEETGSLTVLGTAPLSLSRDADGLILVDGEPLHGACEGASVDTVSSVDITTDEGMTLDLVHGGLVRSDGTAINVTLALGGTQDTLTILGTAAREVIVIGTEGADLTGDGAVDVAGLSDVEEVRIRAMGGSDDISLRGGVDLGSAWNRPSVLEGGAGKDALRGGDGNDLLIGGEDDDELVGYRGDDRFDAEAARDGSDTLLGSAGWDTADYSRRTAPLRLYAQLDPSGELGEGDSLAGIEFLRGGSGDDVLIGAGMNERLEGGPGNDRLLGGSGRDVLHGGVGRDTLVGGREADTLAGADGPDILHGGEGPDALRGGGGNDALDGGAGRDELVGGKGGDTATFTRSTSPIWVDLAHGSAVGKATGTDVIHATEHVRGTPFRDILLGNRAPNRLEGGRGNDDLRGRRGSDVLDGGRGTDHGDGGPGADRCRDIERPISCEQGGALTTELFDGSLFRRILNRSVDPTLWWNTFVGGPGEDFVAAVAKEPTGGSYVIGTSTAGWGSPIRAFRGGGTDAFVARVDSQGNVRWNTFLGGSGQDAGTDVMVAQDGSVIVVGWSAESWGQPVRAFRGSTDGFVAWLDPDGSLHAMTFIGGRGRDSLTGLAGGTDGGRSLVVGSSSRTWGDPLNGHQGGVDILLAEVRRDGRVRWNTFLGGPGDEEGSAVGSFSEAVFVTGSASRPFGSPVRPFSGGRSDTVVAALGTDAALRWMTFLGGSGADVPRSLAPRPDGGVLVGGSSTSAWGNPVRSFQGRADGYVAAVGSDGALRWHTFLGGSGWDGVATVALDADGHPFTAGQSSASWGKPRRPYTGGEDAFVTLLGPTGSMRWAAFFGGPGSDMGVDLTFGDQTVIFAGMSDASWGKPIRAFRDGWTDGFLATVPTRAADAMVARRLRGPYTGRGIYNTTGEDQTLRRDVPRGERASFYVRVRNEGMFPDRMSFAGCPPSTGFGIRYFRGTTDVTSSVIEGTLMSAPLVPGGRATLRVEVLVKRTAEVGATKTCRIRGASAMAPRAQDAVRIVVKATRS